MSAILGGASLLGGMKSDQRLKENIKRVGKTDGGLNIYTYVYKGDETKTVQTCTSVSRGTESIFQTTPVKKAGVRRRRS